MVKTKTEAKEQGKKLEVSIAPIKIATMELPIIGVTSLLMEKMSEGIRQQLVNLVTGQGKEKKKARDLAQEVKDKIHQDDKGNVGFPAGGFKKAMVEASVYLDGSNKKLSKGSFFVIGNLQGDLVGIKFKKMVTNRAVGRDSGINRAPREIWRPEFQDWSATLHIRYNASQISPQQIVEIAKLAGFHIGVGSWNPQHGGNFGTFEVAKGL